MKKLSLDGADAKALERNLQQLQAMVVGRYASNDSNFTSRLLDALQTYDPYQEGALPFLTYAQLIQKAATELALPSKGSAMQKKISAEKKPSAMSIDLATFIQRQLVVQYRKLYADATMADLRVADPPFHELIRTYGLVQTIRKIHEHDHGNGKRRP